MSDRRLLICGSREQVTPPMMARVFKTVEGTVESDWQIVVGDAPGVDLLVIQACYLYRVPFECYGVLKEGRAIKLLRGAGGYITRDHLMTYHQVPGNDYKKRDRVMVESATHILGIWNGHSTGTKYTCDYADRLNRALALDDPCRKVVKLVNFALVGNRL